MLVFRRTGVVQNSTQELSIFFSSGHVGLSFPLRQAMFNKIEDLMQDASWQNQIILQWLSNSQTAKVIDREIGDLKEDLICQMPLLKYYRFNICLSQNTLNNLDLNRNFTEMILKIFQR